MRVNDGLGVQYEGVRLGLGGCKHGGGCQGVAGGSKSGCRAGGERETGLHIRLEGKDEAWLLSSGIYLIYWGCLGGAGVREAWVHVP
jgi:hypothetical protein